MKAKLHTKSRDSTYKFFKRTEDEIDKMKKWKQIL